MKRVLFIIALNLLVFCSISQNVGIGNNNPQSKLHVSGAIRSDTLIGMGPRNLFAAPNGRIYDSLVIPSTLNWEITGNSNITPLNFLGTTNASDLIFRTNNVERGRFLGSNGFLGLGTATPGTRLEISAMLADGISIRPPVGNDAGDLMFFDALGNEKGRVCTNPALGSGLIFSGGNVYTPHVYINSIGNMGIGNTTPNNRLEVTSPTPNTSGLRFTNLTALSPTVASNGRALSVDVNGDVVLTPASSNAWDILGNSGTNPLINFLGTTDNVDLVFRTNNIEWARILNNGRVGIGTATPRAKFDVLNGDAIVADNVFPQLSFNVGRSNTTIFTDNIRPYTDNGFRIYDGNSPSHLHLEATTQGIIQAYNSTTSANPNALEIPGTETILSLNPTGGGVRVGLPNGLSTTINPNLPDNPNHRLTVGSGYFVAGNYNTDPAGIGQAPGTTWIAGVGALAVAMNRNGGRSHVDLWNTSDVTQVAANSNADRGFEFRGYDNAYAERTMARIDGLGQFFSNGTFAISDKRFKTEIIPFNESVLEKLLQVKTYTYKMHQPVSKNGAALERGAIVKEKDFGVLVQELYELFPSVVYKPKDESKEPWSVDYSRFGLYLLQGIKDQQKIISDQKTEIKVLNDKYNELLNRVSKLESK
ncbi:MAG: tail fiber domain-containing protein [Bacteroidetes bacterium]|nr:tail fiber domain-containing protein [Bacteroidota bacterium]